MATQTATQHLKYDRTLGYAAMDARGFYYPVSLTIRPDGQMFIQGRSHDGDTRGARITVMDYESNYGGDFGSYGSNDGQFTWPTDIAVDSDNNLYVADEYLQRISKFDREVNFVNKWGVKGSGPGQINGPAGLTLDSEDNLYVSDHRNGRIQVFTTDGEFIRAFGSAGDGVGQLNLPWGITVAPGGDLFVADWRNDRIQRFTTEGQFVRTYGESGSGDGQLNRPASVAVDEDGYLYIADWANERVQILDPDGCFVQKIYGEATDSVWAQDYLDSNPDEKGARSQSDLEQYHLLDTDDPHEIASHIEPIFWSPICVELFDDKLFILERNRHRIQVYKKNN